MIFNGSGLLFFSVFLALHLDFLYLSIPPPLTSPKVVLSILAFTILAAFTSVSVINFTSIIGVLMDFDAFIISLILGTPSVTSFGVRVGREEIFFFGSTLKHE